MAYKNDEDCFTPSKHSRVCAEHFSKGSSEQNIAERRFDETLFQISSTFTQERLGTDDFYLP